jgi:outer membrane protein assembly factor BamA
VHLFRIIIITFSITAITLGQSLFIEPVISFLSLPDATFHYKISGNYGAHLGINFGSKYDLYFGYKLLEDNAVGFSRGVDYDAEINFKSTVVGLRYYLYFFGDDIPMRLSLEYSKENVKESVFYPGYLSDDVSAKLNGNADGFAIEGGYVFNRWKAFQIFLGVNYRFSKYAIEKIIVNGDSVTLHDFETIVGLRTNDVSGISLKASVIIYPFRKE